ncbi:MAG: 16S rRNA (guanine(527)-N(7))-methyltransferase RsmG [Anaerolineae bacterium]|nr:MAG: 16S rRNA (guanine(527)-N(7))-methyltransferase RsmG [Anaerolineae bacterium]
MHWSEHAESQFGIRLNVRQLEAFDWYAAELQAWNRRFNLTSVTDRAQIEVKHFLDSLSCLTAMRPRPGDRIIDIGTGAGFPGIPIRIACTQVHMVLVESVGKKAQFCRHVVDQLQLTNVAVIHSRAEQVGRSPEHRETFDWAVARAVAKLPTLLEYLLPLAKMEGRAVAQKGDTAPAEAHSAQLALEVLGGELEGIIPVELPSVTETRHLVVVRKSAATPEKYPRRPGIPSKRPI